jgi:hypothetical protein
VQLLERCTSLSEIALLDLRAKGLANIILASFCDIKRSQALLLVRRC